MPSQPQGPSLGLWKVKTLKGAGADGRSLYQITRFDEPVGSTWIFKGQAVREKTRLMRAEGVAVQEKMRAFYRKGEP